MKTPLTEHLAWDTTHLGLPVGKILPNHLDETALRDCLQNLRKQHIRLVYWTVPILHHEAVAAGKQLEGIIVDYKTTYAVDLRAIHADTFEIEGIISYPETLPNEALLMLAYDSGVYSRFRNDPYLNTHQFHAIYKEWITNSTKRHIADDVLIIQDEQNTILGMVTVGEKNLRGDIGLLAVKESARGQQIGNKLVRAAQHYFAKKGLTHSQVVTQEENFPACKLYEKCGYAIEKIEVFFHFWL